MLSDALVSQEEEHGLWEHWCHAQPYGTFGDVPMGNSNGIDENCYGPKG